MSFQTRQARLGLLNTYPVAVCLDVMWGECMLKMPFKSSFLHPETLKSVDKAELMTSQ